MQQFMLLLILFKKGVEMVPKKWIFDFVYCSAKKFHWPRKMPGYRVPTIVNYQSDWEIYAIAYMYELGKLS